MMQYIDMPTEKWVELQVAQIMASQQSAVSDDPYSSIRPCKNFEVRPAPLKDSVSHLVL